MTTDWEKLTDFCRDHQRASLLLRIAAEDYADARCLLLNQLFGGLVQGAQAIEKTLKAYLLFGDPKRDVKKLSHSLARLLGEADALYPSLKLFQFQQIADKFGKHYSARYPDNPNASTSKTTADVSELDSLVIYLNENLPCPRNVKYRTGLYPLITFSLGPPFTVTAWERWIKMNNLALVPLLPRINAEHISVLKELYPTTKEWWNRTEA